MTECDELTRRALERQAVACGCSVEEFILDGALCSLASNEELTFVDSSLSFDLGEKLALYRANGI